MRRSKLEDPAAVAAQYASSKNFDARVRIYELYGRAKPSWLEWLFDQIALAPGERVLEVGSGTGLLWARNAARVPRAQIVLSDLSPGMLATAREQVSGLRARTTLQRIDVQAIPYSDESFDVTLANHMLYHVPDRGRAIGELARVLAPGGRCNVATNGRTHQIEMRELIERFGVESNMIRDSREDALFDLETAVRELSSEFGDVRVARRDDHLEVTDATVLGDYVRSACPDTPENGTRIGQLERYVAGRIEREGAFHLTVAAGVCVARRR